MPKKKKGGASPPPLQALGTDELSPAKTLESNEVEDGPSAATIEKRIEFITKTSSFLAKVEDAGLLEETPCLKNWQKFCRDDFQKTCACILAHDGRMNRGVINAIMSLRKLDFLEVDFLSNVCENEIMNEGDDEYSEKIFRLFLYVGFDEEFAMQGPHAIMAFAYRFKQLSCASDRASFEAMCSDLPDISWSSLALINHYIFGVENLVVDPDVKAFLTMSKWTKKKDAEEISEDVKSWLPGEYWTPLFEDIATIRQLWYDDSFGTKNKAAMKRIAKEAGFAKELKSIVV